MAAWLDVVRAIEDRNESFLQEKYDVLLGKLTSSSFLRLWRCWCSHTALD